MEKFSIEAIIKAVDQGFSRNLEKISSKLNSFNNDIEKTKDKGRSFGQTFSAMALANLASTAIQTVVGDLGALTKEAISASDAADKFKSTMSFAGFDNGVIEKAASAAKKYADDTVYDLETIYNTTAQLAANGVQNYTGLTQAAGNLNAVAGGNADTFKSVAMMLTQTAGAGKLTTENWNQLADAIPGASGMLQKAMLENGAYTGNFRKAMEQGQITAEEFNEAIMKLGMTEVAKETATSTKTIEGALGQLQAGVVNGLSKTIDSIGKENITNLINKIGELVEKGFNAVNTAIPKVIEFFASLKNTISENMPLIIGLGTALATLKFASMVSETGSFISLITKLSGVTRLATAAQLAWNLVIAANPIVLLISVIAGVIAAMVYMWNTNENFRNAFITAWENIKTAFSAVVDFLKSCWESVKTFFISSFEVMKSSATAFVTGLNIIWETIKTAFNTVVEFIKSLWQGLVNIASTIWQAIVNAIMGVLTPFITTIQIYWDSIKTILNVVWEVIKSIVATAINNVKDTILNVIQTLSNWWQSAWNTIKNILNTAWESMKNIVTTLINAILNIVRSVWESIKSTVISAGNSILNAITTAWNNMKNATQNAISSVKNFFGQLWNIDVSGAGRAIMNGFLNGLKAIWGEVKGFVSGIADWVRNNKGPISYDRRLLIPAGKAIMTGFNNSLMDNFKKVQGNVRSMAGTLQSDFNVQGTGFFNHETSNSQALTVNFSLGRQDFTAFVDDISSVQNKNEKIRLKTVG